MSLQPAGLSAAAIALNRFGLGARPDDEAPGDPKAWLTGQFDRFQVRPTGFDGLPDAGEIVEGYRDRLRAMRRDARQSGADSVDKDELKSLQQDFRKEVQALYRTAVNARAESALVTDAPFVERLVHFWSNHFCVSADNPQTTAFAGAFERDAIRPHVLGRFHDMLVAVEQHPAMLIYLNQATSVGPDSPVAERVAERNPKRVGADFREQYRSTTFAVRSADKTGMSHFAWSRTLSRHEAACVPRRDCGG